MEIWPPTITSNALGIRAQPVVAANDNGALLAWTELNATGVTNVMAVAISPDGQMSQPFGHFIGSEGFSGSAPEVYPAGDEFYVVFRQFFARPTSVGFSSATVFARLDNDGQLLAPLQTIVTNALARIAFHSNGQSFLSAWVGGKGETILELFRRDGAMVRTVLPTLATPGNDLKLSSVGRTYLLVEQDRAGRLQGIVVNGYTGAVYTNTITSQPGFSPLALSSDQSQYLLAAKGTNYTTTHFFLLSGDARVLATGTATNIAPVPESKIFRYGPGWVIWQFANYGEIVAYSVTSNGETVQVGPNPLPGVTGQTIAPFGDRRIIVGQQTFTTGVGLRVGYKMVTASGESPTQFPLALSQQFFATVASSPDGYLALWKDLGTSTNLVGVRFSNDGTRLDATPFVVVTNGVAGQVRAVYETNAYHVVWVGSNEGRLIDPIGPPNVRLARRVTLSNVPDLHVTKFAGQLVAYQQRSTSTSISLGSQSLLKSGLITLAGTDDRLFEANAVSGQLWGGLKGSPLDTLARTNMLGATQNPAAVASLETNFFVAWQDPRSTNIIGAIFTEGIGVTTNIVFTNVPQSVALTAASSDHIALLSATLSNNIAAMPTTNFLAVYDKTGGAYSVTSQILPLVTNDVSIASLGKDFVIATTAWGQAGPVAVLQFVTTTAPASATISVDADGELSIKFDGLESTRRYRIERSTDLVNWEFLQSVTQTETMTLPVDAALAAAFYRAVLEPE